MGFFDRSDGVLLRKLPGFRKMFPFLMPTRTESVIFHHQQIRLQKTLVWLERVNKDRPKKLTLFSVVLAACVRTLALRPEANRFVAGRRIYQRHTIDLSFVVKHEMTEESGETNVKLTFDPTSTIDEVAEKASASILSTRTSESSSDEKLCNLLTSFPRCVTRFLMYAVRVLDYFGFLPASFIKGDALYATAFLSNIGGIGLDAVFHHMFEWGNAAFLIVVGKRKKAPVVNDSGAVEAQDVMDIKISLDERITDGVYYSGTIALLTDLIENPERLKVKPTNLPDPFVLA